MSTASRSRDRRPGQVSRAGDWPLDCAGTAVSWSQGLVQMRISVGLIAIALGVALAACSAADATPTSTAVPRTPVAKSSGKVVTDIQQGITPTPATATPTIVAEPTFTPLPFARLEMNSYRVYTDSIGTVWVAGLATNTGDTLAVNTGATLHLRDAAGKDLQVTYATLIMDELQPGQQTPFRGLFANPPKGWKDVRVELRASSPQVLRPAAFVTGLTSKGVAAAPAEGSLGATVAGQVVNGGNQPVILVRAITVALDPAGTVLEIADGYAVQPEIKPGESGTFSTQFVQLQKVDKYKVFLQGRLPARK